ncbi:hypothetical protein Lal_00033676, partial [Lupinus albus]
SGLASRWWKDLGKVRSPDGVTGGWFEENVWKEIGNGLQILFWHDIWVDNQSLKMVFPRLFRLALDQNSWVGENDSWRDDKLVRRRLPTKDELFKRNVIVKVEDMVCMLCNNHVETINYLFVSCDFVTSIWKGFYSWLQILVLAPNSVLDSLELHESICSGSCAKLWRMLWFTIVWSVWIMRNEIIFLEKTPSYVHILNLIKTRS